MTGAADPTAGRLRSAAIAVIEAQERVRDAINGDGHRDHEHDDVLHGLACACVITPEVQMRDPIEDCAACGGAQYGAEDGLNLAYGDLRAVLGMPVRPWEQRFAASPSEEK